jgi:hypothetical protein
MNLLASSADHASRVLGGDDVFSGKAAIEPRPCRKRRKTPPTRHVTASSSLVGPRMLNTLFRL